MSNMDPIAQAVYQTAMRTDLPHNLTAADLRLLDTFLRMPTALQPDIAEVAGVSVSKVRKAVAKLSKCELLVVEAHFDPTLKDEKSPYGKTRNSYAPGPVLHLDRYPQLGISPSTTDIPDQGYHSLDQHPQSGISPSQNGLQDRYTQSGIHVDDHVVGLNEIKKILEFIDEPTLTSLAKRPYMTVEVAQGWLECYQLGLYPEWATNPVGWIVQQIRRDVAPPKQRPLPGGSFDPNELRIEASPSISHSEQPPPEESPRNAPARKELPATVIAVAAIIAEMTPYEQSLIEDGIGREIHLTAARNKGKAPTELAQIVIKAGYLARLEMTLPRG